MTDPAPSTHSAIDVTTDSSSDADIAASTAGAPAAGVQPGESVLASAHLRESARTAQY